jgi:hypothetical protein
MSQRPRRVPLELSGLGGRQDVFRLSGAIRRDPAVDFWLNERPGELRSIAKEWFVQMRQCGDDVLELMHDGCPVACVEDAPFGYVNSFKDHVNVGFFRGAMLEDPAGLLEGSGKRMRHVKLTPGRPLHAAELRELVHAAYVDIRERLGAGRSSKGGGSS